MLPLDNAVWTALTTKQAQQAHSSALARRFPPEMTLLGALAANTPMAFDSLAQLIQRDAVTLYFTAPPKLTPGWDVIRAVELHQMVQETEVPPPSAESEAMPEVIELTPVDVPEMSVVYAATRPGRTLCPRIQKLGQFLGIRQQGNDDGKLVAMGGLRLHLAGYREITTVATLPGHEGRGYATAIMRNLIDRIHARSERPFLTVRTDNTRALEIYRRLGFKERTRLYSHTIQRTT
ncbi:MAG TPA: GNAT family N-acetyltransferase [Candidatus Polarisedimenticolia bacterium]|jgi:ribosomal protein S18 acetylase RimI-like enzyme|nr:GNAT family N-acetyltransferase [Candidatus Polarisedimenticolia bacterium]